jgi:hypothetical protein
MNVSLCSGTPASNCIRFVVASEGHTSSHFLGYCSFYSVPTTDVTCVCVWVISFSVLQSWIQQFRIDGIYWASVWNFATKLTRRYDIFHRLISRNNVSEADSAYFSLMTEAKSSFETLCSLTKTRQCGTPNARVSLNSCPFGLVLDACIRYRLALFGLGNVYRVNMAIVNKKWLKGLRKEMGKAQNSSIYGVCSV